MTEAHVDPTRAQFEAFKSLDRDRPIMMINLIRYRPAATYPDDHARAGDALTGAEAYKLYSDESGPVFRRVGGEVVWAGAPMTVLIGPEDESWPAAFVARAPTAHAFPEMLTDPDYKLAVVHRQAAVATSRLIRCEPRAAGGSFA